MIFFKNPMKVIFRENVNFDQNLMVQLIFWSIQSFQCFQGGSIHHIDGWIGLSCHKTYWSWFIDSSWSCHVFFQDGNFQFCQISIYLLFCCVNICQRFFARNFICSRRCQRQVGDVYILDSAIRTLFSLVTKKQLFYHKLCNPLIVTNWSMTVT